MKTNNCLIPVLILNVCLLASHAQTFTPAFEPSTTPPFIYDTIGYVNLGMVFTPTTNITVNALGFYDLGVGTGDEPVGIFDSSGNLVVSSDVTTSDTLADGYFWASIAPVILTGGQQYTVVAYNGNYDYYYGYGVVPTVNSQITYDAHTYFYTSNGLTFPTYTVAEAADAYYGPNFSIGTVSITWTNPAPIPYGTALSSNQLDATANVPGSFAYNPTNGTVLNVGTNTLSVTFTPTDTNDYSSVTDTVSLVVFVPQPIINIQKAVYLTSTNLFVGFNYQVQASSDLINWTNQSSVFTATNSNWQSTNYWDVNDWDQLFFQLQLVP